MESARFGVHRLPAQITGWDREDLVEMGRNAGQTPFQLSSMPFSDVDPALGWAPGTPFCVLRMPLHLTHTQIKVSGSLPWSPATQRHGKRQQTRRQIGSVGGESGNLSQTDMGILATPSQEIVSRPHPHCRPTFSSGCQLGGN